MLEEQGTTKAREIVATVLKDYPFCFRFNELLAH